MKENTKIIFEFALVVFIITYSLCFAQTPELIPYRYGDKWGYCDQNKSIIIPCTYDETFPFSDKLGKVKLKLLGYGFVDKTGKEIIPCKYDIAWDFAEGTAKVCLNDKWGLIDKTGQELTEIKYYYIGDFIEGIAKVEADDFLCGFIDNTGMEITLLKYLNVEDFHDNFAAIEDTNKFNGFIDKTGKEVIPLKYHWIDNFNNGLAPFAQQVDDDYYLGYLDEYGNELEKNHETNAKYYGGLYTDKQDDKYGLLNSKGEIVVPYIYNNIENFINGFAQVTDTSGYLGFMDRTGNIITPLKYYEVNDFSVDGFARVSSRGIGFINRLGKETVSYTHLTLPTN